MRMQPNIMPQHVALSDMATEPMSFPGQSESTVDAMVTGNEMTAGNIALRQKEHSQRSDLIERGFIRSLHYVAFPAAIVLFSGMIVRLMMFIASIMATRNLVRNSVTFELPQGLTAFAGMFSPMAREVVLNDEDVVVDLRVIRRNLRRP